MTYLEEGTYTFTLNSGARFTVYASPYTPEFCDWAFAYKHMEDRFNQAHQVVEEVKSIARNPVPDLPNVDIIMKHGPPKGILDEFAQGHVECPNLLQALRRSRPLMHCFDHIHEGNDMKVVKWISEHNGKSYPVGEQVSIDDQGGFVNSYPKPIFPTLVREEESLMVNAAIVDERNEPTNAPWIVDLDLSCGEPKT